MKAIVVGAGHAGLAAGHRLQKAGWEVVVLEAGGQVGGRVQTIQKNGYTIERGATQMSTGYKAYQALARDIGLDPEIINCTNKVAFLRHGRLYEIDGSRPLTAMFSGFLSPWSKLLLLRTVRDFLALKPRMQVLDVSASHAQDTETAHAYALRRLNQEIYDVLVDPLMRAYTLNRGDKVSKVEWFSGLANLAGEKFLALRGGNQNLPKAVAARLNVRTDAKVTEISRTNQGVAVSYVEQGAPHQVQADACILATRLPEAVALAPAIATTAAPLAEQLRYNQAVLAHLGYRVATNSKAIGVLLGTAEHRQIGLIWLEHNKDPGTAPAGHALITCYFEHSGLAELGETDDAGIIAIAQALVEQLFPELRGQRDLAEVSRWPLAIPNPAPGIYKAIDAMKRRIDPENPVQLAGDYFTCTGQNSAIHWGQKAAETVLAGKIR